MKEFYIAPEVEILRFAPVERLASGWNDDPNSPFVDIPGVGDVETDGEGAD